jgi:dienelactone hydrolase
MPGWVHTALANGYVAFVLDSFTQRGFGGDTVCNGGWPGVAPVAVRARDAFDALAHLKQFPFIDKARIGAMGFSHGARVAYLLSSEHVAKDFASAGRFAAVVAVYGQCFSPKHNISYVRDDMSTPLLALLGAEDHDGDPKECIPRLDKVKADGAPVQWHLFDGVGHVWDQPSRSPGKRMPFDEPPGWTWFAYDAKVTEQSHALAFDFLGRAMR